VTFSRAEKALTPISRVIDGVPTLAQSLHEKLRGFGVVLNKQYLHRFAGLRPSISAIPNA
jgi:hypothetical protein